MTRLTKRQREMLQACAERGIRTHTRYEYAVMDRLYSKGLALLSCNGTDKWHATAAGRAALSSTVRRAEALQALADIDRDLLDEPHPSPMSRREDQA